jgi:hypothetical protein
MKKLIFFSAVVCMAFIYQGCSKQIDAPLGDVISTQSGIHSENNVDFSNVDFKAFFENHTIPSQRGSSTTTEVYTNDQASLLVDGSSTIHRNHKKFTLNMQASDAPNLDVSGHACTLWTLVWHSAEEAFGGAPPYAMYRVGGNVSGGNSVSINGVVKEGESGADYYNTNFIHVDPETGEVLFEYTGSEPLVDAENAFMVSIVKSHGPMDPAEMPGQILTFGGGCDGDPDGGGPATPCHEYIYSLHF